MTAKLAALAFLFCCSAGAADLTRHRLVTSALPFVEDYSVFLPPSYGSSSRAYPVLYFLHDVYSDSRVLGREGVADRLAAEMEKGAMSEFIIVSPEGHGSWFSNFYDGSRLFEDAVTRDLPREIERLYRVLPGPRNRAITGVSMGGYAAIKIALRHPEEYGSASSLSGAVMPLRFEDVGRLFWLARRQLHRVFGSRANANSLAENDIWRLLAAKDHWDVPFDVFLLAGTDDKYGLDRVAAQLTDFLNRKGIRAESRLEPGGHDWRFWRRSTLEIARWHAEKFPAAR